MKLQLQEPKLLDTRSYEFFCNQIKNYNSELSIESFRDKHVCETMIQLCSDIFKQEIYETKMLLDDKNTAIAYFDIPESDKYDKKHNAICGVAIVVGLFNALGRANVDPVSNTPFTLHVASHSNVKKIEESGFGNYTPEVKLGFHNDGLLSKNKIEIPKHIATYNLYISYKRPGNFIWVPTKLWEESSKFRDKKHRNMAINIKLTPTFHLNNEDKIYNSGYEKICAPLTCINQNGDELFFLNGQVLLEDNSDECVQAVNEMRRSLSKNYFKIRIPQKERRVIFLNNPLGFHARDIFEEPIEGVDLSRVMLRMVDVNAELYPSQLIQ
jgi:hypothetical protein